MEGAARIEPQYKSVDERFRMMAAVDCPDTDRKMGNWYTAVPPLVSLLHPAWDHLIFLEEPGWISSGKHQSGIINVAIGGCKIELFDKDTIRLIPLRPFGWREW